MDMADCPSRDSRDKKISALAMIFRSMDVRILPILEVMGDGSNEEQEAALARALSEALHRRLAAGGPIGPIPSSDRSPYTPVSLEDGLARAWFEQIGTCEAHSRLQRVAT